MKPTRTTQPPAAAQQHVRLWNCLDVAITATQLVLVRISNKDDAEGLFDFLRALLRSWAGKPEAAALENIDLEALVVGPAGDRRRRELGLQVVRFSDLDPRAGDQVLAYVGVNAGVVLMFVPSTAIADNLPAREGDRVALDRNAAMELIQEAIKRLPQLQDFHVPTIDRLFRSFLHIGPTLHLLRRQGIGLWVAGKRSDLSDPSQLLLTSMSATTNGDLDALTLKTKTLKGRIDTLEPTREDAFSGRDFAWFALPMGYGPRLEMRGGLLQPVKKFIIVNELWTPYIQYLWNEYALGTSIDTLAMNEQLDNMPLRNGASGTIGGLPAPRRRSVIRQNINRQMAILHQTGSWPKWRYTAGAIDAVGGHALELDAKGHRGRHLDSRLPVHLVDGLPWGVTAATWEAVFARLNESVTSTPALRGRNGPVKTVITSSLSFAMPGGWGRLVREHGSIQLRIMRTAVQEAPAYDCKTSELIAACNAVHGVQVLGQALMEALLAAGIGQQPVESPAGGDTRRGRLLDAQLTEERLVLLAAQTDAGMASELAAEARKEGVARAAAAQLATQDVALGRAEDSQRLIAELERAIDLERHAKRSDEVEMRVPLAVAAAMMRWNGSDDIALSRALERMGIIKSLTATYNRQTAAIDVVGQATLMAEDGVPFTLKVAASWPNTSQLRAVANEVPQMVSSWALGASFDDLSATYRQSPSLVRKKVLQWLGERGLWTTRTALLDCPIPLTRQIVVSALAPELLPAPHCSPEFTAHVRVAYLRAASNWKAWLGNEGEREARGLAALSLAGGPVEGAILDSLGVRRTCLAGAAGGRPAIVNIPASSSGARSLFPCPHEGCGGWADHYVYTPETSSTALLCSACLRVPDVSLRHVVFPVEYLQFWRRETDEQRLRTVETPRPSFTDEEAKLLTGGFIRMREVAEILKLSLSGAWSLKNTGVLPSTATVLGLPLWERTLVEAHGRSRVAGRPVRTDGWLSPDRAALLAGVSAERIRFYCKNGLLPCKRSAGAGSNRRISPDALRTFKAPPGDLITSFTMADLARAAGCAMSTVRYAIDGGDLVVARTSFVAPRVTREEGLRWLQSRM